MGQIAITLDRGVLAVVWGPDVSWHADGTFIGAGRGRGGGGGPSDALLSML